MLNVWKYDVHHEVTKRLYNSTMLERRGSLQLHVLLILVLMELLAPKVMVSRVP